MSSLWKKPTYNIKQLETHWVNNVFHSHDLWCHCEDTITHFMSIINKQNNAPKPLEDIKNIKCLITGIPTTKDPTTEEEEPFGDGELEKLFAEDAGEGNSG